MALPLTAAVFLIVSIPVACGISRVASKQASKLPDVASASSKAISSLMRDEDTIQPGCLSGKRIVFVGPSSSRYDYLMLAYYLEHGVWPVDAAGPRIDLWEWDILADVPAPNGSSRPEHCAGGGDWEKFYAYTNEVLTSKGGHELCDCWRSQETWKDDTTENRFYETKDRQTKLAYFQWWSKTAHPRGVYPDICPPGLIPHEQWRDEHEWNLKLSEFLKEIVAPMQPTHLVIASGVWELDDEDQFWHDLLAAGAEAVSFASGTVYWKTPPLNPHGLEFSRHQAELQANLLSKHTDSFKSHGWTIFPAQRIIDKFQFQSRVANEQVFHDEVHLTALANSHLMNTFLHDYVCSLYVPNIFSDYTLADFETDQPLFCLPDYPGNIFIAGFATATSMLLVVLAGFCLVRIASSAQPEGAAAQRALEAQQEAGEIMASTTITTTVSSPGRPEPVIITTSLTSASPWRPAKHPSIEALNGMRTLLVSYVIVLHFHGGLPPWATQALVDGWPMQFFFVLSGFILQYVTSIKQERLDWSAGWKLIVRRWMRLVPLYEVAIVMRYITELLSGGGGRPWMAWPMNAFLLQGLFPLRVCMPLGPQPWHHNFVHFNANGVGWFTAILMWVTCCFPVLYNNLPCQGVAKILPMFFGIIFVRALPELVKPAWGCWNRDMTLPEEECHGFMHLYSFAPLRLLEFAAGMLTSSLVKHLPPRVDAIWWGWVFDGLCVLAAVSVYLSTQVLGMTAHFTGDYFLTPVWCLVCAVACLGAKQQASWPSTAGPLYTVLSSWPLAPLGQYSFEAYILHAALLVPFFALDRKWRFIMNFPWSLIFVWAVSYVVDHFVQAPLTKRVNAMLIRK